MPKTDALCTDQSVQLGAAGTADTNFPHDQTQNQPPEILSKIFRIVCGRDVVLPLEDDGYPWILGHVCSRWRQILWNSFFVWRKIVVHSLGRGSDSSATPVDDYGGGRPGSSRHFHGKNNVDSAVREMLTLILQRVASPVSLKIIGSVENVLDIILSYPKRFSTLSLANVSQDAFPYLLDLPSDAFTALEEIFLSITATNLRIPGYATLPFNSASKLRKVMYRTQESTYIHPLFIFPCSRLEEIRVDVMELPLSTIHNVWRYSPCLISCAFDIANIDGISTMSRVTLPALRSLQLTAFFDLDWNILLSLIMVPSLESLNITASRISPSPLASLISRSRCVLKKLSIYEEAPDDGDGDTDSYILHSIFHHLPEATRFAVSWTLPTSVIQSIDNGALPALANAEFAVKPEAFDAFLNMIDSYVDQPGSRPRSFLSFSITCHDGPGLGEVRERYRARLETYRRAGGLSIYAVSGSTSDPLEDESEAQSSDEEDYEDYDDVYLYWAARR